jgi:hypothetical protein
MSAYLMVSLHTKALQSMQNSSDEDNGSLTTEFSIHQWWNQGSGWKNTLNNLRLILQPFVMFNVLQPWLKVFPIPQLALGFFRLIAFMNQFKGSVPTPTFKEKLQFSSA